MSDLDERVQSLVLARSATALRLASTLLAIADPCHPLASDPTATRNAVANVRHLEALNCALMRYASMSWDTLSAFYEISRQSLHRRLATHTDSALDDAQEYISRNREDIDDTIDQIWSTLDHIVESFWSELEHSSHVWGARRAQPGWWHRVNDEEWN